jgi:hypothetical protein
LDPNAVRANGPAVACLAPALAVCVGIVPLPIVVMDLDVHTVRMWCFPFTRQQSPTSLQTTAALAWVAMNGAPKAPRAVAARKLCTGFLT